MLITKYVWDNRTNSEQYATVKLSQKSTWSLPVSVILSQEITNWQR